MTKMWKVVYGSPAPVEVEAEVPCWPNRDESGEQIFDNKHFLTLEAAWKQHLAEHRAGFSLAAGDVTEHRRTLADADKKLVNASLAYDATLRAHKEFLRGDGL